MKKMRFVLAGILILCICLIASCADPKPHTNANTEASYTNNESPIITFPEESTASAFVYDTEKYPLSEGHDSPDGMKAAIKLNGKYYEGDEYYHYWLSYGDEMQAGNDYYSGLMDNSYYPHSIDEIPEGCPIIKLSKNDKYELISEYGIRRHYFMDFFGYSNSTNEYKELPDQPGIYLLVAITPELQGIPWFSETFVKPETYTEYVLSYQYVFAVIVE